MFDLYLIIFGLGLIVIGLIVQGEKDCKDAYEKGFTKGLYYNVVRMTEGNEDMEVVSANGVHYK